MFSHDHRSSLAAFLRFCTDFEEAYLKKYFEFAGETFCGQTPGLVVNVYHGGGVPDLFILDDVFVRKNLTTRRQRLQQAGSPAPAALGRPGQGWAVACALLETRFFKCRLG